MRVDADEDATRGFKFFPSGPQIHTCVFRYVLGYWGACRQGGVGAYSEHIGSSREGTLRNAGAGVERVDVNANPQPETFAPVTAPAGGGEYASKYENKKACVLWDRGVWTWEQQTTMCLFFSGGMR